MNSIHYPTVLETCGLDPGRDKSLDFVEYYEIYSMLHCWAEYFTLDQSTPTLIGP